MIVDNYKLVFIHVIKTAGVSIETQFGCDTHDHRTAVDYKNLLGESRFNDYFSFTVIRNPWDKMVSQYFYNAFNWVPEGTTFKEYIEIFGSGKQVTRFSPFHLPYITDKAGKVVVDYIGRFEALEQCMQDVYKEIDMPYQALPHKNKTERLQDYTHYYDDKSRGIVSRLFAEEIEMFGYEFER